MRPVEIAGIRVGAGAPVLIAGPCVIEGLDRTLRIAEGIAVEASKRLIPVVFKASFDKANRTSGGSYRGPGLHEGLEVLRKVKQATGLALTTDVHLPDQAAAAAQVVDLLQVPAFLCRQTDLLRACGATRLPVNIKKGQFATVSQLVLAAEKALDAGADGVLVTERGTSFGHGDLVVDLRQLVELREAGLLSVFDATHSGQRPGGATTDGDRRFATALARAALAVGTDALFAEVHDDPANALSDAATQLPLAELGAFLDATCVALRGLASEGVSRRTP